MKFIKYFFVGGIAALVDFLIFALFVKVFQLPWFISGITGFVLATLVNYLYQSSMYLQVEHDL